MSEKEVAVEIPKTPAEILYGEPEPDNAPVEAASEVDQPADGAKAATNENVAPAAPEMPTDGTEAEATAGESDEPADASAESEEVPVQTLEELAEAIDADPEWLRSLETTQKVNGKEIKVRLDDALRSYRTQEAAEEQLAEAKARTTEARDYLEGLKKELGGNAVQLAAVLEAQTEELKARANSIDWNQLRADDPAEWTAKQKELETAQSKIQQVREDAVAAYQQALGNIQAEELKQRNESLPKERDKLLTLIPEWKDTEIFDRERDQLVDYLGKQGYSQQEIEAASFRASYMALAVKAMRFDRAKGKQNATKKKIAAIPKVLKPGSKSDEQDKPSSDQTDRASLLYG